MNFTSSQGGDNKYLYNGKELQDDVLRGKSLDWYDYGARFYDPSLGRFTCLDPIAEEFYYVSPYNYAENSPIANVDLWGLQALNAQIYTTIQANKAKYTAIAQQGGGSLMNLAVGSTRTDRIPSDVRASMSSGTQSMINFSGKVSNAANVAQTVETFGGAVRDDALQVAETTGDVLTMTGIALAPVTAGASLALTPIGEGLSTLGSAGQATVAFSNGDIKTGAGEMAEVFVGLLGGGLADEAISSSLKVETFTENSVEHLTHEGIFSTIIEFFSWGSKEAAERTVKEDER
jgi:RHS repeat-associated protein